jgi:hypothetical protein
MRPNKATQNGTLMEHQSSREAKESSTFRHLENSAYWRAVSVCSSSNLPVAKKSNSLAIPIPRTAQEAGGQIRLRKAVNVMPIG